MKEMKEYCLRIIGLFLCLGLAFAATAYAEEKPYLVLEGPDRVQVGQMVTYSVKTVGGTDSGYEWWLGYSSNGCATLENGVFTAIRPGIAGIRVSGNDTGALAQLHVEVVSNENGGVSITGPDKLAIGSKAVFSATTGGVSSSSYNWFIVYSSALQVATVNADTGELEGVNEGLVILCAVDMSSGLSGEKTVQIVRSEKQTAMVSISAGLGEGFTLNVMLSIKGDIPDGASLYIAVLYDGVLHYLPGLGTSPTPFRTHPTETFFEKVLSVPITDIPYKQYTFYAALLDSSSQFVSNLDTAGPISAGYK